MVHLPGIKIRTPAAGVNVVWLARPQLPSREGRESCGLASQTRVNAAHSGHVHMQLGQVM